MGMARTPTTSCHAPPHGQIARGIPSRHMQCARAALLSPAAPLSAGRPAANIASPPPGLLPRPQSLHARSIGAPLLTLLPIKGTPLLLVHGHHLCLPPLSPPSGSFTLRLPPQSLTPLGTSPRPCRRSHTRLLPCIALFFTRFRAVTTTPPQPRRRHSPNSSPPQPTPPINQQ